MAYGEKQMKCAAGEDDSSFTLLLAVTRFREQEDAMLYSAARCTGAGPPMKPKPSIWHRPLDSQSIRYRTKHLPQEADKHGSTSDKTI